MLQRTIARSIAALPSQYTPYRWLLNRVIEHGCAGRGATMQLLTHPEAPPPWEVFSTVLSHSYVERNVAIAIIETAAQAAIDEARNASHGRHLLEGGSTAAASSSSTSDHRSAAEVYAMYPRGTASDVGGCFTTSLSRQVTAVEGLRFITHHVLACPRLGRDGPVLDLLCRSLLFSRQREQAVDVFMRMAQQDVTQETWLMLVRSARLGNSAAVARLVALDVFPLSWRLPADAAANLMLLGGPTGGRVRPLAALAIMRRYLAPYVLHEYNTPMPRNRVAASAGRVPADTAEAMRVIHAWSSASEAPPELMEMLQQKKRGTGTDGDATKQPEEQLGRAAHGRRRNQRRSKTPAHLAAPSQREWAMGIEKPEAPDAVPFRLFFEICKQRVESNTGTFESSAIHWRIMWRTFQLFNRTMPSWPAQDTTDSTDSEQLVLQVIDILTRGASPWLAFHLARHASQEGLVDGVDVALYLLMRTHRGQYIQEGAEVAKVIFGWLLGTAEIYRRPERQNAVLNACRVLIHLHMQSELAQLYELVLDYASPTDEKFRREVIEVLSDVVCPSCNSMLKSNNPHEDRRCDTCGEVIEARQATEIASFEMTEEARTRLRARLASQRKERTKQLTDSVKKLRHRALTPSGTAAEVAKPKPPRAQHKTLPDTASMPQVDAAQRLRDRVLAEPIFASSMGAMRTLGILSPEEVELVQQQVGSDVQNDRRLRVAVPQLSTSPGRAGATGGRGDALLDSEVAKRMQRMGAWTCCWCGERHDMMSSRHACSACGAQSGPAASWREPLTPPGPDGRIDPVKDFRARVKAARQRDDPDIAVGAGFHLLLYRRAFLMRAVRTEGDFVAVTSLVSLLCVFKQRVLAAAVYFTVLPPALRQVDDVLYGVAQAFGHFDRKIFEAEATKVLRDRRELAHVVLGRNICLKCYGDHPSTSCPLITRNFKTQAAPGGMTPKSEMLSPYNETLQLIRVATAVNPPTVTAAYASFLALQDREDFAREHAPETNFLAQMLRSIDHVKRAALVVCHVPLHLRSNEALAGVCTGFSVDMEDYVELLAKRKFGDADLVASEHRSACPHVLPLP
jgi:hypothetical protein